MLCRVTPERVRRGLKLQEREAFLRKCLRGASKPLDVDSAKALAPIDMATFKVHCSELFPLILDLLSKGQSFPQIEALLGFKRDVLSNLAYQYPRINKRMREARAIQLDDSRMSEMPNDA